MSIINDALRKAQKNKRFLQKKTAPILEDINQIQTDVKRFASKKWLLWTGTGLVCILTFFVIIHSFKKPFQTFPLEAIAPEPEQPKVQKPEQLKVEESEQPKVQVQKVLQPEILPEKIIPPPPTKSPDIRLSGILYDGQKPLAILNESIVGVGSSIQGAEILEIQPDSVRLSFQGKEFTLKVK